MAYTPNPAHFRLDGSGHGVVLERDGALFTGPVDTFLISYWQYGFGNTGFFLATDNPGGAGGISFAPNHRGGGNLVVGAATATTNMLSATYSSLPDAACPCHFLVSVRLSTSTVQFYLNDAPITGSIVWTTPGPITFVGANTVASWGNPFAPFLNWTAGYGSDFWFGPTSGFVDLSVVANRRKFINADLTPVDLGSTGSLPFGTSPRVFQNVLSGGVASDWLINRGAAGGTFLLDQSTITLDGNPCPPPSLQLAMDNVICTAEATLLSENLVSLRWSDDRGHSFGSPVSQSIGEVGEYRTSLQWQRLAYARDRVFEISWSVPMRTALQGCWVDVTPAQS